MTDGLGPVRPRSGVPNASQVSIAPCEAIFKTRTFSISSVGNFNDVIGVDPSPGGTLDTV